MCVVLSEIPPQSLVHLGSILRCELVDSIGQGTNYANQNDVTRLEVSAGVKVLQGKGKVTVLLRY